jgi:hypothetical protein
MFALLQMKGPRINSSVQFDDVFENVNMYNIFCAILKITPAPNNGSMTIANKVVL